MTETIIVPVEPTREMTEAAEYLVRRPSCIPFTLHESKWLKLPLSTSTGDAKP